MHSQSGTVKPSVRFHGDQIINKKLIVRERRKLGRNETIALQRSNDLSVLGLFREHNGILTDKPIRWCRVRADTISALCALPNRRLDEVSITAGLSAPDRAAIDPDDLEDLFDYHHYREVWEPIMPARRAGYLVGLTTAELLAIQRDYDYTIRQLYPVDETPEERAARRAARKREKDRGRQQRCRARKRATNLASGGHAINKKDTGATQAASIVAAVREGASTIGEIANRTGLIATTISPLLSKEVRKGEVQRTGRGRYSACADIIGKSS
jgi:hypothetical protein